MCKFYIETIYYPLFLGSIYCIKQSLDSPHSDTTETAALKVITFLYSAHDCGCVVDGSGYGSLMSNIFTFLYVGVSI